MKYRKVMLTSDTIPEAEAFLKEDLAIVGDTIEQGGLRWIIKEVSEYSVSKEIVESLPEVSMQDKNKVEVK